MEETLEKFDVNREFDTYRSCYYWGNINGKTYNVFFYKKKWLVYSKDRISDQSKYDDGSYVTPMDPEQFDDIICEQLFAKYIDRFFHLSRVGVRFEYLRLDGTGLTTQEASKYGFVYDRNEGQYYLDVALKNVELYSKKTSVLHRKN